MRSPRLVLSWIGGLLLALLPGPGDAGLEAEMFRVRSLAFAGLGAGTLSETEILDVRVKLTRSPRGYLGRQPELASRSVRIGDLVADSGSWLAGSAMQAIVNAIADEHRARGLAARVDVLVGALQSLREPGSDGVLVIELSSDGPVARPLPAAVPDRFGRDAVLVTVRSISFAGVGLPVREDELLALSVDLGWDADLIPPGYVAPRRGLPVRAVPLWNIGGWDREGAQLYGSALDRIRADVAAFLNRSGSRARVRLNPRALRRLATPGSDGLLLLDVQPGPG